MKEKILYVVTRPKLTGNNMILALSFILINVLLSQFFSDLLKSYLSSQALNTGLFVLTVFELAGTLMLNKPSDLNIEFQDKETVGHHKKETEALLMENQKLKAEINAIKNEKQK